MAASAAPSGAPATGAAFAEPSNLDNWTPGDKLGVGTAYTYDQATPDRPAPSRVWFALIGGAIAEL
jgi:hypothetical protein